MKRMTRWHLTGPGDKAREKEREREKWGSCLKGKDASRLKRKERKGERCEEGCSRREHRIPERGRNLARGRKP